MELLFHYSVIHTFSLKDFWIQNILHNSNKSKSGDVNRLPKAELVGVGFLMYVDIYYLKTGLSINLSDVIIVQVS